MSPHQAGQRPPSPHWWLTSKQVREQRTAGTLPVEMDRPEVLERQRKELETIRRLNMRAAAAYNYQHPDEHEHEEEDERDKGIKAMAMLGAKSSKQFGAFASPP